MEKFHIKTRSPVCALLYHEDRNELICGDVAGDVTVYNDFPSRKFANQIIRSGEIQSQGISSFVVGICLDLEDVISAHNDKAFKCWRTQGS